MSENVIGDAYVKIHALTRDFNDQIKNSLKDFDRDGERAGDDFSGGFNRSLARGLGVGGGGGRGGFFSGLRNEAEFARQRFQTLLRTSYVLGPVITGLVGGIGSLASAFVSLVSVLGGAIPALAVVGTTLSAIFQGALVARIALKGVAQAIQAGFKAQKADNKEREGAEKRLTRARRSLAQAYEDSAKRLADADEAVAEAQERVNKAREQAREDLQQLGFDSEDAAIAEQRAAIELEKARETLARVADLPVNSRARKEAQLAFAEADLNYRRAIDRNSDLRKEVDKNASLGNIDKQIDGQESVVEAEKNVTDALKNKDEVLKQNQRSEIAAKEAVQDAKQALDDASKSANAYEDALKDLSKEAQSFVRYVVSLREEFKKLREAAGREFFPALERSLENLVENLFPRLEPLFLRTGKALGFVALNLSDVVTKGDNLNRLERVFKTNDVAIVNLGLALGNLYESLLIISDVIRPLTEEFTAWTESLTGSATETLRAKEANGELQETFETAAEIVRQLGRTFRNVFGGLGNLISANVGPGSGGQILLNYFEGLSVAFKNLETIDGKPIREFFADSAIVGIEVLGLLGDIVGAFIRLGDNPGTLNFVKSLREVVGIFEDIGENLDGALTAFGEFLVAGAEFTEVFTESGSIEIFFDVLRAGLEAVTDFARSDVGQSLIRTFAPVLATLSAIGLAFSAIRFFSLVAFGGLSKLVGGFSSVIGFLGPKIKDFSEYFKVLRLEGNGFFGAIRTALSTVSRFLGPIGLVVGLILGAYAASEDFRNSIAGLFDSVRDVFSGVKEELSGLFQSLDVGGLQNVFKFIGDFLAITIIPTIGGIIGFVGGFISGTIQLVAFLFKAFGGIVKIFKGIGQIIQGLLFGGLFSSEGRAKIIQGFKNIFDGVFDVIRNVGEGIGRFFSSIINGIIRGVNAVGARLKLPKIPEINLFKTPPKYSGTDAKDRNVAAFSSRSNNSSLRETASAAGSRLKDPFAGLGDLGQFNMDAFKFSPINPASGTSLPGTSPNSTRGIGASASTVNITNNVYPAEKMNETELAALISRQIAFQLKQGVA